MAQALEAARLHDELIAYDARYWLENAAIVISGGRILSFAGHEYQAGILMEKAPVQCAKKGAQLGFTEIGIVKTLHGMIYGHYPQGCLYLFPTTDDVTDFTKARFNPLIAHNPQTIGQFVQDTDAATIKKINGSMLYLRGAKATRNIEGIRKTSSKLKSIPVDRIVYDERDEMDQDMVDLALERVSHSSVKEITKLSTPTVPDYGIDKDYKNSDARVWMIRCAKCGKENVLELEFPNCLGRMRDGRVLRICVKCGNEIQPREGQWIAQYPSRSKEMVGWWISQLNSMYVAPAEILRIYEKLGDPAVMSRQEFYNSKLAMAYVDSANRLTRADFEKCVGLEAMAISHEGPCGMGVDVGKYLHVAIGIRVDRFTKKILHVTRLHGDDWNGLYELGMRFGLHRGGCCVIDGEPERSKAREFQANSPFSVYLFDYQDHQRGAPKWDTDKRTVVANRNEMLDRTHSLVTAQFIGRPRLLEIPRIEGELNEYVIEMCNLVKVRVQNDDGSESYVYKQTGPDHYRHATVHLDLALDRVGVYLPTDQPLGMRFRPDDNYADPDPLSLARRTDRGGYSTNPF